MDSISYQKQLMSPSRMLSYNLSIVLRTIKEKGPLSRADIARELECSRSTVSGSIGVLQEMGLVCDSGRGNAGLGRKSVLLRFRPEAYFFVAVDLRWKTVSLALVDLAGRIHAQQSYRRESKTPASLIRLLVVNLKAFIESSGAADDRIEGIGIMVPGIVNTHTGVVEYSQSLGWESDVPLARSVGREFAKPIIVFNDGNALALAETWIGMGRGLSHLAYIYAVGGVGGACLYNGEIILGADSAAGEMGKILVTSNGVAGRAEHSLSIPAMLSRYCGDPATKNCGEDPISDTLSLLRDGAGNVPAAQIVEEVVDRMAQVIVGIVALFNPPVVVVRCSYLPDPETVLADVTARVREYLPGKPKRTVKLVPSGISDTMEVIGGAAAEISRSRFRFIIRKEANYGMDNRYLVEPGRFHS